MGGDATAAAAPAAASSRRAAPRPVPRAELSQHDSARGDGAAPWVAIDGAVYDISTFARRHPGGRVLTFYAGEDATDAFHAFHAPATAGRTRALMKPLLVGPLVDDDDGDSNSPGATAGQAKKAKAKAAKAVDVGGDRDDADAADESSSAPSAPSSSAASAAVMKPTRVKRPEAAALEADFRALTKEFEREGLFEASKPWYAAYLAHIFALELAAFACLWSQADPAAASWPAWIACAVFMAVAQVQAGWLQHDFGHVSVFKQPKHNQWAHWFTIGSLKGASSSWWKMRHNRHHAKTNVMRRDPDIHVAPLFLFSTQGKLHRLGWLLTPFQKLYWWVLGPPLVTTVIFVLQVFAHLSKTKEVADIAAVSSFFVRLWLVYGYGLGLSVMQITSLYFFMRLIESHWFTWITSMSHLPRDIELDTRADASWIEMHVNGTQNVEGGFLNDWITGHLNYQVEHHLMPRMPRHNYEKIQPRIETLLHKHGLVLRKKSLISALADILSSLDLGARFWKQERDRAQSAKSK